VSTQCQDKGIRKLLAIMFVDVVGFTAMTAKNEESALLLLEESMARVRTHVIDFQGQWLKQIGDGSLAAFDSAVNAVLCGQKIQQEFSFDESISLRIGIHVGDVVFRDDDIWGDGVNVASRIESQAPAGGICISETVHDALASHPDVSHQFLGEKVLKGVGRGLNLYLVDIYSDVAANNLSLSQAQKAQKKSSLLADWRVMLSLIFVVALSVFYLKPNKLVIDGATIAVLPFDDFSAKQNLGFFAGGLTEELLNVLARIPQLDVASRTSTSVFNYDGKSMQQVARELGVRYLVEGSVRDSAKGVRVTVQIIDGKNNKHVFSDVFDASLNNAIQVQESVSFALGDVFSTILSQDFSPYLVRSENVEDSSKAYLDYLKGIVLLNRYENSEDLVKAEHYFMLAMQHTPEYAKGLAGLCRLNVIRYSMLASNDVEHYVNAVNFCERALAVDPNWLEVQLALAELYLSSDKLVLASSLILGLQQMFPHHVEVKRVIAELAVQQQRYVDAKQQFSKLAKRYPLELRFWKDLAMVDLIQGNWQQALSPLNKAYELSPKSTVVLSNLGTVHYYLGDFQRAEFYFHSSLKVKPEAWLLNNLGAIYYFEHDFDKALSYFLQYQKSNDDDHVVLASIADCYAQLNNNVMAMRYYQQALDKSLLQLQLNSDLDLQANIAYYQARLGHFEEVKKKLNQLDKDQLSSDGAYFIALAAHIIKDKHRSTEFVGLALEKGYPDFLVKKDPILNTIE